MAYTRFSDTSQTYIFRSATWIECVACRLRPNETHFDTVAFSFNDPGNPFKKMLAHMQEHVEAGHNIPNHALTRMSADSWVYQEKKPKRRKKNGRGR